MNSTRYIVLFILSMTCLVAVLLTGTREVTKEQAAQNEAVFNKRAVLASVGNYLGQSLDEMSDEQVLQIFEEKVEQKVLDMNGEAIEGILAEDIDMAKERKKPEPERRLPLYIYESEGDQFYILSVRGNGLWDEIWGTVALKDDLVTVAGAAFDHKGETPGLGAEIKDNPAFAAQFENKRIFGYNGEYTAVVVRKGGAQNPSYEVDGISGATVTADGVTEMLKRGIKYYEPYLSKRRDPEAIGMK